MKALFLPSLFGLLATSVCFSLLQYQHVQRLERQLYVTEYGARTFHYILDQEEEYLQAVTEQLAELSDITNKFKARYYAKTYIAAARRYGVDPYLLLLLTRVESGFDAQAKSNKGALGMMQIMPNVWLDRISFISTDKDLLDPYLNIHAGARVLRHYLDRADGDVRLALLMYNRGEQSVNRDIVEGRDPHNGFVQKVLFNKKPSARLGSFCCVSGKGTRG
ncbi:MAG: lytic transglycosylase domain-containing protein [Acidiferrobacterales bacterium]